MFEPLVHLLIAVQIVRMSSRDTFQLAASAEECVADDDRCTQDSDVDATQLSMCHGRAMNSETPILHTVAELAMEQSEKRPNNSSF